MKKKNKIGRVLVITGASSGIGKATAFAWAKEGGSVVLAARSTQGLEEVAQRCTELGGKALVVPTDVSVEEEVNTLTEEARRVFGKIDVWVNNAAVMVFGDFNKIPTEDLRTILDINLYGTLYGSRAALETFIAQEQGILINMSSLSSSIGQAYSTPYSLSKAAIRNLSISLGQEMGKWKNIHVCTVLPSIVDTPIFQKAANYTGRSINPPTSVTPANKVAQTIMKLTKKPQPEVYVGKRNLLLRLGRNLAPKLFDKIYRVTLSKIELEEGGVSPTQGNLYQPLPQLAGISGGWLKREKEGERITIKKIAGRAVAGLGLIACAAFLLSRK